MELRPQPTRRGQTSRSRGRAATSRAPRRPPPTPPAKPRACGPPRTPPAMPWPRRTTPRRARRPCSSWRGAERRRIEARCGIGATGECRCSGSDYATRARPGSAPMGRPGITTDGSSEEAARRGRQERLRLHDPTCVQKSYPHDPEELQSCRLRSMRGRQTLATLDHVWAKSDHTGPRSGQLRLKSGNVLGRLFTKLEIGPPWFKQYPHRPNLAEVGQTLDNFGPNWKNVARIRKDSLNLGGDRHSRNIFCAALGNLSATLELVEIAEVSCPGRVASNSSMPCSGNLRS